MLPDRRNIPLVTVIMAVKNHRRFLFDSVGSILTQTFSNFEFLIVDDGSDDGSCEIMRGFSEIDKRVEVFVQRNKGLTKSLNWLIQKAKGSYIARMDADDISHPRRFEKQVQYLQSHSKCGVVGTGCINIDENGGVISGYVLPDNHVFFMKWLEKGINVYKHGSIMLRKKMLDKLDGPYRFYYGQDYDLLLRLSEICRLGMVQEVLFKCRITGESIQGYVSPIRGAQKVLMLDLYFNRKKGVAEYDWRAKESELLRCLKEKDEHTGKNHSSYAIAVFLFQTGSLKQARAYFNNVIHDPRFSKNAKRYIALTYLPKSPALMIQRYLSFKGDKWRTYRVPLKLLKRIDGEFSSLSSLEAFKKDEGLGFSLDNRKL